MEEVSSPATDDVLGSSAWDERVLAGVYVVDLERFERLVERRPFFVRRSFTEDEQAYCKTLSQPGRGLAVRFAAKMAVCKALGIMLDSPVSLKHVEVVMGSKARPHARLGGKALDFAKEKGVLEIPLSLSYTHSEAVACAMAITQASVTSAQQRVDQKAELAKRFRAARSLLDELAEPTLGPTQESLPGIR